ncbi:MAG: cyclic nucleotide-binding/CBS domain-containing protein [Candidatus Altarchaeaceae archaeon]
MGGKIKRTNAGDIMTSSVITCDINEGVMNVCKTMAEKSVGSIIVIENDTPVGIITERDIVKAIGNNGEKFFNMKAKDIMSHPLFTAIPSTDIEKLEKEMRRRKIKHVPIIASNRLVGIVTSRNIVEYLGKWRPE